MALPEAKIYISKNGDSRIDGQEKSDVCFKLAEMAKQAGKVTEDTSKDFTPVYQTVSQKGN